MASPTIRGTLSARSCAVPVFNTHLATRVTLLEGVLSKLVERFRPLSHGIVDCGTVDEDAKEGNGNKGEELHF